MNCPLQTHASCSRDAGDVAQPWAALWAKSVQIWSLGITLGFKDSFRNFLIMIESYTAAPQKYIFRLRRMWLSTLNSTRSSGKAMLQQRPPTCTRSQYSKYPKALSLSLDCSHHCLFLDHTTVEFEHKDHYFALVGFHRFDRFDHIFHPVGLCSHGLAVSSSVTQRCSAPTSRTRYTITIVNTV